MGPKWPRGPGESNTYPDWVSACPEWACPERDNWTVEGCPSRRFAPYGSYKPGRWRLVSPPEGPLRKAKRANSGR